MGSIGEYVHLSGKGYLAHGITRKGAFTPWASQKGLIRERMLINDTVSQTTLDEIRGVVKAIQDPTNPATVNVRAAVQELLNEILGGLVQSLDMSNLTTTLNGGSYGQMGKVKRTAQDGHLVFDLKKITTQVDQLEQIIAATIESGTLTPEQVAVLHHNSSKVRNLYKEIYGNTYKQIANWGYKPSKTATVNEDPTKINELRKVMNDLIEEYASYPPVVLADGTLWEAVLAAAETVGKGSAVKAIKENIEAGIKGGDNVSLQSGLADISSSVVVNKAINSRVNISAQGEISRRSKVDVQLNWNGEDVKISAKNIAMHGLPYHWVTVVSGSPLLTMVGGVNIDFLNHFLNIYSTHNDGVNPGDGGIADEMKLLIWHQALTGDILTDNSDMANIFAVNDKTSGDFTLVPMTKILDVMEDKVNSISVQVNGNNIKGVRFQNNFDERGLDYRIANLVAQLHALKVTVKFDIGASGLF